MTATEPAVDADLHILAEATHDVLTSQSAGGLCVEVEAGDASPGERLWRLAVELGWPGIGLDEARGGSGGGPAELTVLFEQFGRWLAPGPFLGSCLYSAALSLAGDAVAPAGLLAASGLGFAPAPSVVAVPVDGGQRAVLTGVSRVYQMPGTAGGCLVFTRDAVHLADPGDGAVRFTAVESLDPGCPVHEARFAGHHARILLTGESARRLTLWAHLLIASSAVGICGRMLEVAVEYAKTRTQFGKPIGAFQAVKHRCAQMAVRERAARAAVFYAAAHVDAELAELSPLVGAAASVTGAAAARNAEDCLETHGAMGHTWEFVGHRYLKRAYLLRAMNLALGRLAAGPTDPPGEEDL
ncbi:acyl-CoA dehydrogenase family protein [Phytohabitans kaempferiae]|uniref:Acyl-CoA dehydrogenase family protein n=1 Tax=Phytohabitans kaempferiae TaxID=1620943 RepID=A0ABV6MFM8_9ACTN